jgi:hypothetical protein
VILNALCRKIVDNSMMTNFKRLAHFLAWSIKYHNAQLHPLSHVEKLTLPRDSRLMSFDETRYEHHRLCNGYCARLDRVKTKIMELVFVSSPLSTQH